MKLDIIVPQAGESVSEAMVGEWLKAEGSFVEMDEPIVELETEKSNLELTAEDSGTLQILVSTGTVVKPGDIIGSILLGKAEVTENQVKVVEKIEPSPVESEKILSPAARRVAAEGNLDVRNVQGSGKDGRITKQDAVNASKASPEPQPAKDAETLSSATLPASTIHRQKSAPLGPQGTAGQTLSGPLVVSGGEEIDVVPMSMMRRRIAQRLVESQQTAAILTTFNEVDMTSVMEMRNRLKDEFQKKHGAKLGFMSFFVKACVSALKTFPEINARIDETNMIFNRHCHIGVAVGTPKGLVVPVIRYADRLSFAEIESSIAAYAEKARSNKIGIGDLEGGTFTVSNGGIYGSLLSTPILNPPQSGILGMHKIEKRPIVVNDQIVIRPMMYLALSYDHRIVDGEGAVSFLIKVKECLEDPSRMLLEV